MLSRRDRTTILSLLATLLASTMAAQRRGAPLHEASANFDLEDVEPFLTRVVALVDSGFSSSDAKALAAKITKQPVDTEREYSCTVFAEGARTRLRIVVFMDDVDAPDMAFFADAKLAGRIDAAIKKYFEEVGK